MYNNFVHLDFILNLRPQILKNFAKNFKEITHSLRGI